MKRATETRSNSRILLGILMAVLVACVPSGPEDSIIGPDEQGEFSVTLAWDPPTRDAEGHPLDDLEAFRIYHSTEQPITRDNATMVEIGTASRHTLEGLPPGTWYFAVTAVDSRGNESEFSEIIAARLGAL